VTNDGGPEKLWIMATTSEGGNHGRQSAKRKNHKLNCKKSHVMYFRGDRGENKKGTDWRKHSGKKEEV